jgi:hypothetical protein
METFLFPYHLLSEDYPDSSDKVQFGRGWEFASAPKGPDQIVFVLSFPMMQFYETTKGSKVLDLTKNVTRNMGALIAFYERNRGYNKFIYPHPWRGNVIVRFDKPLQVPKGIAGANGITEAFEIRLKLQP